jgi:hypothetical protein
MPKITAMKPYVGMAKIVPDSLTPRRFMRASTAMNSSDSSTEYASRTTSWISRISVVGSPCRPFAWCLRPLKNGDKQGRLIVRRKHEHGKPLSDRCRTISEEPDHVRAWRHNDSGKALLHSGVTTRLIRAAKSSLVNAAGTEGLVVVIAAFSRFWRPRT